MNKNKLAALITSVLCGSVSPVSIADVNDIDTGADQTSSITTACRSSEISIFQGDSACISVRNISAGTTVDSGSISIYAALDLNASTDSLFHITAGVDININAPSIVGRAFSVPTASKLNLNFSRYKGVLPVSGASECTSNVIGSDSIVGMHVSLIQYHQYGGYSLQA